MRKATDQSAESADRRPETPDSSLPALRWQRHGAWAARRDAVETSPRHQFEKAQRLERAGHLDLAAHAYMLIPLRYPFAQEAPKSLVGAARTRFHLKRYDEAYQALHLRLRQYPDAPPDPNVGTLYLALGRVYFDWATGKRAVSSQPSMGRGRAFTRAQRAFDEMVQLDPYSRLADNATYHLGLIAMEREKWVDAIVQFKELLLIYKHSDLRANAEAQIAVCLLKLHWHPERSSAGRLEALDRLDRAEIETRGGGEGSLTVDLRAIRQRILAIEAERLWRQALFYEKLGKLAAAGAYFRILKAEYPDSARKSAAGDRLEWLRERQKRRATGGGETAEDRANGPEIPEPRIEIQEDER